jgi:hypothetical protein
MRGRPYDLTSFIHLCVYGAQLAKHINIVRFVLTNVGALKRSCVSSGVPCASAYDLTSFFTCASGLCWLLEVSSNVGAFERSCVRCGVPGASAYDLTSFIYLCVPASTVNSAGREQGAQLPHSGNLRHYLFYYSSCQRIVQ